MPLVEPCIQNIKANTSIADDQIVTQAICQETNAGDETNSAGSCISVKIEQQFNGQNDGTPVDTTETDSSETKKHTTIIGGCAEEVPFVERGLQNTNANTSIEGDQIVTQAIGQCISADDENNLPGSCTSVKIEQNFNGKTADTETRNIADKCSFGTEKFCARAGNNSEVEIARNTDMSNDTIPQKRIFQRNESSKVGTVLERVFVPA
ncbi:hypothetical protein DPMN_149218 [Dreissena polymorpha]|uniref:Uncharacterized protein n=1 Tax=Dreissena polymorpha TaxID=45954 RepID=A0A9D4FH03_DREPO|nr:hypothetical protein DPMN_149218 [Dreissena polymorpha]